MYNQITCCLLIIFSSLSLFAAPKKIIIIRHAEKINDIYNDLSPQGCQRAYLLKSFFKNQSTDLVAIYALQPNRRGGSIRSLETIAPTSDLFGVKINNKYQKTEYKKMTQEILNSSSYKDKTVVIVWQHSGIIDIVESFGLNLPKNLKKWPSRVFDQAWVLNRSPSNIFELKILAQKLLPNDIDEDQSGTSNWGKFFPVKNNGIKIDQSIITECNAGNSKLNQILKNNVMYPVSGLTTK